MTRRPISDLEREGFPGVDWRGVAFDCLRLAMQYAEPNVPPESRNLIPGWAEEDFREIVRQHTEKPERTGAERRAEVLADMKRDADDQ